MALCNLVLGIGMFFLMQVRYSRNLARGTRRLTFANLMGSPWDAKSLEELWEDSAADDRMAIEDVLATETHFASELEVSVFRGAVTGCSVYTSWLARLRTGRMLERVRAARMLGYFPDGRGIQALTQALHDRSPKVVLSSLLSLGRLRALAAVPELVKSLPDLPRTIPNVTLTAVLAGCARQEPESLAGLMKSADERLRLVGAWAISEIADTSVLTHLVAAIADRYPEVRAKVARGLGRIPDAESVAALQIMVRDPVWFVRYRALRALGDLRAPEGTDPALSALADEVREVRYGAAYALRKIRGMESRIVVELLRAGGQLGFDSLISEWDRAGFLYLLAGELTHPAEVQVNASREFLKILIDHGITSTLESFVLLYPDPEVRWMLANLLLDAPRAEPPDRLLALVENPRCDPRIAELIQRRAGRPNADVFSRQGAD